MLLFHNEGLMDIKQEHNISQVQTLSQAQVMSLNILSMDSLELNEFLYKEYLENPLLENKCENNRDITLDIKNMDIPSKRQHSKDDIKYLETPNTDEINIKHYILYQLNYDDYSKNDLVIMEFLIDCLDNNGYFNYELTEISEISDYNIGDNDVYEKVAYLAPKAVVPGEMEMEALALGALRVLSGEEEVKEYL